ncbi:MAG: RtcB family protein [Candidatus Moraniibacteriota bacterium]
MYEESIKKINSQRSEMKTAKMKVPVIFHVGEELMPSDATLQQLESVARNDSVSQHVAAMADVHSKPGRKNATGTTVVSGKYILPQVNDSDPACGMRIVRTNLTEENTTPEELDALFKALVDKVPTKKFTGTSIPFDLVVDICRDGIDPLIQHLGIETKNEAKNSIDGGNFFEGKKSRKDIFNVIPKLFLFFAQYRLGILGAAGNHFLDLMKVTDIVDPVVAEKFNLKKGQYLFMVHCGSGILGQYSMYMYTAKKREHLSQAIMVELGKLLFRSPLKDTYKRIARKIKEYGNGAKEELFTYEGHAPEGEMYMAARKACSNWAHANRATITHNVSETVKEVLARDPEFDLLYDMPHILVSEEEHFGKKLWVHRNGTTRSYGPSRMKHHPVFGETGEPSFIPTSMSTEAYLSVGTDENESSFFSCNHGAGKAKSKTDSVVPGNREELEKKLAGKGVKLYNGRSSKVIEQDSSHYKRSEAVIESVTANGIGEVVAKMQPVSVIMY